MKVSLNSYTQPTPELAAKGIVNLEELIAHAARVSNPANQFNTETSGKLISHLIKNKHWSPLEVASITLEIETTRAIAHQILRHRSFSFQEFSQRYAVTSMEFDISEARLQDTKNRQNSLHVDDPELQEWWRVQQVSLGNFSHDLYHEALKKGIAKEQARNVLPEGMTKSKIYMAGSLRSWVHYVDLRTTPGTQKEHREVAIACGETIKNIFPRIADFIHLDAV